jgi:alkaline phosphatase D
VWDDPKRTLLGLQQEEWLDGVLAQKNATWTLFGQQTLFGARDYRPGPDRFLWNDGWDGYPAARKRLTETLQRREVPNPVMLGGDVHENWVGHIKADYGRVDSASLGVELCGTSITSRSAGNARLAGLLAENPHFVFAESEGKGYGVLELTPQRLTATLRVVDDVTKRETRIATLAAFTAQAGRARLERI